MPKKEIIWRDILYQAIKNKKIEFTQQALAEKYGFSLSTVFNALKPLRGSSIIQVGSQGFKITDIEKFLYLWATFRNIKKDVIYRTNTNEGVQDIEGKMPPKIIFGAFSAYCKKYREAPADYDKVYVYAPKKQLDKIKNRFPPKKGYADLIVLESDQWLKNFGPITPDCQTFADLWNLPDWYAKDFLEALKEKILK